MSLPFAGDPDESKVYQSLKSELLTELTSTQFETLRNGMFAEGINGLEDEYRRLLLLGMASNTYGFGPIAATAQVVSRVVDANETSQTIFTPSSGEVWQVIGGSLSGAAARLFLFYADNVNGISYEAADESITAGQNNPLDFFGTPMFIDENISLKQSISGSPTGDVTTAIGMIRVR